MQAVGNKDCSHTIHVTFLICGLTLHASGLCGEGIANIICCVLACLSQSRFSLLQIFCLACTFTSMCIARCLLQTTYSRKWSTCPQVRQHVISGGILFVLKINPMCPPAFEREHPGNRPNLHTIQGWVDLLRDLPKEMINEDDDGHKIEAYTVTKDDPLKRIGLIGSLGWEVDACISWQECVTQVETESCIP